MINIIDRLTRWVRFNLMYLGSPPWDTGIIPPELVEFISNHTPGRAIDLGCGTGTNLVALAKAGWQVTGVDFALKAVHAARDRLAREGCQGEVRRGDVSRFELVRGKYDLVLDIGCYHGLPQASRKEYRSNLSRILANGGFFLWYTHWNHAGQPLGVGTAPDELLIFQEVLALEKRQDSQDRWGRSASWFLFRKKD